MHLDTKTNVFIHESLPWDCLLDVEMPVVLQDKPYHYLHKTGILKPVINIDHLNLVYVNYSSTAFPLNGSLIHTLVLNHFVDFGNQVSFNDLAGDQARQNIVLEQMGFTVSSFTDQNGKTQQMASNFVSTGTFAFLHDWTNMNANSCGYFYVV